MYNQFFTIKPRISEKRRKQSCTSNNINIYHVLGRDHVTFLLERKRTKRTFLCMYVCTYTHIHTKNFHFLRFRSRKKITWLLSWICKNRREDEKWSRVPFGTVNILERSCRNRSWAENQDSLGKSLHANVCIINQEIIYKMITFI